MEINDNDVKVVTSEFNEDKFLQVKAIAMSLLFSKMTRYVAPNWLPNHSNTMPPLSGRYCRGNQGKRLNNDLEILSKELISVYGSF